jgi:hypothetical protein
MRNLYRIYILICCFSIRINYQCSNSKHLCVSYIGMSSSVLMRTKMQNGVEEGIVTAEGGGALMPESACLWSSCGKSFGRLDELVQHIHKGQINAISSPCMLMNDTRARWYFQINVQMHVGRMPALWSQSYLSLCTYWTYSFAYW